MELVDVAVVAADVALFACLLMREEDEGARLLGVAAEDDADGDADADGFAARAEGRTEGRVAGGAAEATFAGMLGMLGQR